MRLLLACVTIGHSRFRPPSTIADNQQIIEQFKQLIKVDATRKADAFAKPFVSESQIVFTIIAHRK